MSNIEENNKLIAEFYGLDEHFFISENVGQELREFNDDELRFDTSWDWLMPVANEIIKSRDEQNADWDLTQLKYALCTTNIELVYKAVVEFIKWYNKSK
jgi:hypothetical protein